MTTLIAIIEALDWGKVAAGGAAIIVLATSVVFLRFLSIERDASREERTESVKAMRSMATECHDTQLVLQQRYADQLKAAGDRNEKAMERLIVNFEGQGDKIVGKLDHLTVIQTQIHEKVKSGAD